MNGLVQAIGTGRFVLSDEELSRAYELLAEEMKTRRDRRQSATRASLEVGQAVKFFHSDKGDIHGTVRKVKYKKALVEDSATSIVWDVPFHMLKVV